jgi:hypothetical protein
MGKKKRKMISPKYAKKCTVRREIIEKTKNNVTLSIEEVAPQPKEIQDVQVVELKKETTPEPVLETVVKPVTIENRTEPVNKKTTTAKKTQKFAKKKPTAKKRSTKAKSTRSTNKISTKD